MMSMNIKKGEIWEAEFFPQVGSEISKKRPGLVVSDDRVGRLPLKTIVPITDWKETYENYPWMIQITENEMNGLKKLSGTDCFQVRNFSHQRFIQKIGEVDEKFLFEVHETILKTLNPKYKIIL